MLHQLLDSVDDLGGFLSRRASAARSAYPAGIDVTGQQLVAAPGHGGRVDAQQLRDLGVAAVPDLERFQPGVQPALTFIEQAVEQHNGGLELIGQHP